MKKHWWILMGLLTVASLAVELTMHHDPAHSHWWSYIPGFYIAFGFIGCAVIIIFAKKIVNLLVDKEEDYYDSI